MKNIVVSESGVFALTRNLIGNNVHNFPYRADYPEKYNGGNGENCDYCCSRVTNDFNSKFARERVGVEFHV